MSCVVERPWQDIRDGLKVFLCGNDLSRYQNILFRIICIFLRIALEGIQPFQRENTVVRWHLAVDTLSWWVWDGLWSGTRLSRRQTRETSFSCRQLRSVCNNHIHLGVQSCVFSKAAATVTEWFSHVNSTLLPRTNFPYISFFVVYSHSVPLGNLVFVSEES